MQVVEDIHIGTYKYFHYTKQQESRQFFIAYGLIFFASLIFLQSGKKWNSRGGGGIFGKGGGTGPDGGGAGAAWGARPARGGAGAAGPGAPAAASGAGARSTFSLHVGHVCCRWNHSRKHAAWNM